MKTKCILYLDDDTNLAEGEAILIKMHFRTKGIYTHIFTDVAQLTEYLASDALSREQPVLAIVDLWMIDKVTRVQNAEAGFIAIDKIRSVIKAIPVMVVSAHIDAAALDRIRSIKQSVAVDKIIAPRELIEGIEKALSETGAL